MCWALCQRVFILYLFGILCNGLSVDFLLGGWPRKWDLAEWRTSSGLRMGGMGKANVSCTSDKWHRHKENKEPDRRSKKAGLVKCPALGSPVSWAWIPITPHLAFTRVLGTWIHVPSPIFECFLLEPLPLLVEFITNSTMKLGWPSIVFSIPSRWSRHKIVALPIKAEETAEWWEHSLHRCGNLSLNTQTHTKKPGLVPHTSVSSALLMHIDETISGACWAEPSSRVSERACQKVKKVESNGTGCLMSFMSLVFMAVCVHTTYTHTHTHTPLMHKKLREKKSGMVWRNQANLDLMRTAAEILGQGAPCGKNNNGLSKLPTENLTGHSASASVLRPTSQVFTLIL